MDYKYQIEYEYDFSILISGFTLSQHKPISSHELLSLPKTNMKNKGSGNVTSLKFKNRTRTQFRTCSPIWRSLLISSCEINAWKNIQAGMRFKHETSAIPVLVVLYQLSYQANWELLTLLSSSAIYPWMVKIIWKIILHVFKLKRKTQRNDW